MIDLPLQKLPKNVADLGKLTVAKALKSCPKSNKLPNLVTLILAIHGGLPLPCRIAFYCSSKEFHRHEKNIFLLS